MHAFGAGEAMVSSGARVSSDTVWVMVVWLPARSTPKAVSVLRSSSSSMAAVVEYFYSTGSIVDGTPLTSTLTASSESPTTMICGVPRTAFAAG